MRWRAILTMRRARIPAVFWRRTRTCWRRIGRASLHAAKRMAEEAEPLAADDVRGLYHYHQRRFGRLAEEELPDGWAPLIALDEK